MTPEEQRIEIAEESGQYQRWKQTIAGKVIVRLVKTPTKEVADYWRSYGCEVATGEPLTDPPKGIPAIDDLNVIAGVEKTLSHDQWRIYLGFIMGQRIIPKFASMEEFHKAWNATAAQRVEAFLKTVGRWRE